MLYVGKARDLRKRVMSYFSAGREAKIKALLRHAHRISSDVVHTENEALILESTLIKKHKPRYNVVLRDDKSYPYIHISTEHDYPRLAFHRGAKKKSGNYFGPYPNAGAVRSSLSQLQKLFRVRLCEDSFFENRTRPCLQHQIDRCTAPCVGLIDQETYESDIKHSIRFLQGYSQEVIETLVSRMEAHAENHEYERAADIRDQISRLKRVQQSQVMVSGTPINADLFACVVADRTAAVYLSFVRGGSHLGGRSFFPRVQQEVTAHEILNAFVPQYYFGGSTQREIPHEVILADEIEDRVLVESALAERAGRGVTIKHSVRAERAKWIEHTSRSAELALSQRLNRNQEHVVRFDALAEFLNREALHQIECFDISHTRGEGTVASCVVFGREGAQNDKYRRFNINDVTPGDDYAAMAQALRRRYLRRLEEEQPLPDVIIVDGGLGQLRQARELAADLQLTDVVLLGVAKGPTRKAGLETLYLDFDNQAKYLAHDSKALHLIQQVRDEAHRFAITGHRKKRAKAKNQSILETIPGIGAKRRQTLLKHFGGMQGVRGAGVDDLSKVPGISAELAREIYDAIHG